MKTKSIQLDQALVDEAEALEPAQNRSVDEQIEHQAYIGKLMEENPDLPYAFVSEVLNEQSENNVVNLEPYHFGYDTNKPQS